MAAENREVNLTIGVFAGFLNGDGKLLIQRRKEKGSVISDKSFFGDYELPGGDLTPQEMDQLGKRALWDCFRYVRNERDFIINLGDLLSVGKTREEIFASALEREILEEKGLVIDPGNLLRKFCQLYAYQTILVQKRSAKVDIALAVSIGPEGWSGAPTGEFEWADAERIRELSQKPKGEQVLSGWGKRMCQMMLWCLTFSSNHEIGRSATSYLYEIQKKKGYSFFRKEIASIMD